MSFEAGVVELGGHPMVLRAGELQLARGESLRDTALVLSRHVAAIGLRTSSEERLRGLAEHATVPVVNMLSPLHHPCQALADLMTMREAFGSIEGRVLTYVGDGNNVARSLALVGALAGVEVRVAAPEGFQLEAEAGARAFEDPAEAVDGADVVYTDVWVSLNDDETEAERRREALAPVPARRGAARPSGAARLRAALPAGPPGGGDHRGRALRRPPAHLGPGGEPPPRPEGAARAARFGLTADGVGLRGMSQPKRLLADPLEALLLTRERIQEVLDDAVARGRMTGDDAAELLAELVRRGRRQVDADPAGSFPITGYDDLTAAKVIDRLEGLTPRRAAGGPQPRAPQREPQVGPDRDRAPAALRGQTPLVALAAIGVRPAVSSWSG